MQPKSCASFVGLGNFLLHYYYLLCQGVVSTLIHFGISIYHHPCSQPIHTIPCLHYCHSIMEDAEERLRNYLQSLLVDNKKPLFPRVSCCGTSRSFYCTECSKLLIPVKNWPLSIQNGTFTLPVSDCIDFC